MNIEIMRDGIYHIENIHGYAFKNELLWDFYTLFAPNIAIFTASGENRAHKSRLNFLSPHPAA